jgi:DNA invertase Pin-like site-specific DNA recombinase
MKPIGYSYIRFSTRRQGKGTSLHRQTQDTVAGESPETWCSRNGVKLDTSLTFRDLGRSAWQGHKQAELYAFLDAVKTGRILPGSFLLVEKLDRISRKGVDEGMEVIKKILNAGISIVTLGNGRVYGPKSHKKLKDGLLELQFYLEAAEEYSETLSRRVRAATAVMRTRARTGQLVSAKMPPWLAAEGKGTDRRAVVIPEKAAIVQRIFDELIAGKGLVAIERQLVKEDVPPLTTGQKWAQTTLRRLVTERAVLGEYQPCTGRGKDRKPIGDVIENYFPPIISLATYHKALAAIGSRKRKMAPRSNQITNLFTGLLKDARNGGNFKASMRITRQGKRYHVLLSASDMKGPACSFPMDVFERAILSLLREVNPKDLLPPNGVADEVLTLAGELSAVEAEIAAIAADMDREYSETLHGVLRRKEARKKTLAAQLAEARSRAASPFAESLGETQSLLETVETADDPAEAKLRLRAALRRIIESIWVLVVRRGTAQILAAQIWFAAGEKQRSYLIVNQPARANRHGLSTEGGWSCISLATVHDADDLDLRRAADAAKAEAALSRLSFAWLAAKMRDRA